MGKIAEIKTSLPTLGIISVICGRFSIRADKNKILGHYGVQEGPDTYTGYNVVPSYGIPVIRKQSGKAACELSLGFNPSLG